MDTPEKPEAPAGGQLSRRTFLGTTAAAAAGLLVVPRHVVGATQKKKAPSDTLNIGCVGVGGKGFSDIQAASTENIAALCDVDDLQTADFLRSDQHEPDKKAMYEKAAKYRDWRRMLEKEKGLDAITVSTPDHNHAVIAMAGIKLGKHVFVQKPLTHTVKEARLLAQAAREAKVTTQMGNQGHAKEGARLLNEWVLHQKYLQVLEDVGEKKLSRARETVLTNRLGSLKFSIGLVLGFARLKLSGGHKPHPHCRNARWLRRERPRQT